MAPFIQNLPTDYHDKLIAYQCHVINLHQGHIPYMMNRETQMKCQSFFICWSITQLKKKGLYQCLWKQRDTKTENKYYGVLADGRRLTGCWCHRDYSSFMCNGYCLSPPLPPAGNTRQCTAVEQNCLEWHFKGFKGAASQTILMAL